MGRGREPRRRSGTDLFVMARDERRFDLGQVVGVRVKSGRRYFKYRSRSGGAVVGWWFRDGDRAHIDAWLSHALSHLIVLAFCAGDHGPAPRGPAGSRN